VKVVDMDLIWKAILVVVGGTGQNRFGSTPSIPTTVSDTALQKENDLFDEVVSGSHPIEPSDELK
jgi:hypothetical protein